MDLKGPPLDRKRDPAGERGAGLLEADRPEVAPRSGVVAEDLDADDRHRLAHDIPPEVLAEVLSHLASSPAEAIASHPFTESIGLPSAKVKNPRALSLGSSRLDFDRRWRKDPWCKGKKGNSSPREEPMKRPQWVLKALSALGVSLGLLLGIAGCYYPPPPGVYTAPSSFDRSWSAAIGAFSDEGVQIVQQDRATGTIRGTRSGIAVTAEIRPQADGSVRVEFGASGNTAADPSLNDRISRSYSRRMGR
jgi:hypothetical protein